MFHKILIANRGEIALRIIRTCRELGIRSVLAHSKADAHSLPMRVADETICVGPDAARLSYLNIPAIISAAAVTDSEAIHPGYGFLAENPAFAEVCRACSITFIGPSPEAIRLMGDKAQARQIAMQAGVPAVPGSEVALKDSAEALEVADRIGYPIMFKAAAGGGGRGMRIVRERAEVVKAFDTGQTAAGAAFDPSDVYCEQFIEMNTRIQVEHPVTEALTGIDLVREQIRVASGEALGYRQDAVRLDGHAIECRINAEDPETFAPSAGRVTAWVPPGGFGVRVDSHLMAPYAVPPFYDSLLAKIVVRGADRAEAIDRMRRALRETVLEGVKTSIPFHLKVLDDPAFLEGRVGAVEVVRRRGGP